MDTTYSREERQSRKKRFYVFFSILWAEHTLLCTDGTRRAMEFGPHLEEPTFSLSPQQAATRQPSRCEIQARPPRGRRLSSSRCCKSWMAGSRRPPGGGTSCGPRLPVQQSVSSREQAAGAHGSCRDSERKQAFQHRRVRDADAKHLRTRGCCRSRSFHNGPRTLWCSVTSALHTIRCGCLTCIHLAWMRNPVVELDRSAAT